MRLIPEYLTGDVKSLKVTRAGDMLCLEIEHGTTSTSIFLNRVETRALCAALKELAPED